jgi:4-alpha-glucanotransferase
MGYYGSMMRSARSAGVLLHPTSLPGPFGIGDLGPKAVEFVEFLGAAGQRVWQVLPLGPTGYGDSPYQALSTFAGNPLLVSLDLLIADGLLTKSEAGEPQRFASGDVDYEAVNAHRRALWPRMLQRFDIGPAVFRDRFDQFCAAQAKWLDDYALFMAIKEAQDHVPWTKWETDIAARDPTAVASWSKRLANEVRLHKLIQFLFFAQWRRLKAECAARAIDILGDLPIFAAHDSADVWSRRELFRLDADGCPTVLAGVPPDYFSESGQLWGNPHYDWRRMERSGYAWWIDRVRTLLMLVDRIRLDHFRGFVAAWEVPHEASTAMMGKWQPGPGAALFETLQRSLGAATLPFVAENLGVITPEVETLRQRFGLPGMAILQFAFGTDPQAHDFKPHNYSRDLVVYTGTHDNDTTIGWWTGAIGHSTRSDADVEREREHARRYLQLGDQAIHWAFIQAALSSVAHTAIIPAQDLLGLDSHARMNRPGEPAGNWRWRLLEGQLTRHVAQRLAGLTEIYERV